VATFAAAGFDYQSTGLRCAFWRENPMFFFFCGWFRAGFAVSF
jgi:hypothetical protein